MCHIYNIFLNNMCVHCMQVSFCENGYHMFYHHELQENLWHLGGMVWQCHQHLACASLERGHLWIAQKRQRFYGLMFFFFFFSGDSLTKTHQFGVNPPAILVALICPISCWTYRSTNPEPKKTWWLARRFWKNQTFGTLKDFPKSFRFICEDKAWCCFLCRRFIFCCIFFCEDHLLFFLRASH